MQPPRARIASSKWICPISCRSSLQTKLQLAGSQQLTRWLHPGPSQLPAWSMLGQRRQPLPGQPPFQRWELRADRQN